MSTAIHEWFRSLRSKLDERPRLRDRLRRGGLALLVAYAAYLLLANIFLNTPLAKLVNRKPERFDVQWSWAISLYPGQFSAHGVELVGKVKRVAWTAHAEVARGRLQLLPLLRRRVAFGVISAHGVSGALRFKQPLLPPPRDNGKPPWGVRIGRIDASDLRGFDIGPLRLEGDGTASVSLDKVFRGGPLVMAPSSLQMHGASLRSGDLPLLQDADIDVGFSITPADGKALHGIEWLAATDAAVKLKAAAPGVEIHELADDHLAIKRGKHDGRVDLDMALKRGRLVPGGGGNWSLPIRIENGRTPARDYALQASAQARDNVLAIQALIPPQAGHDEHLDASLQLSLAGIKPVGLKAQLKQPALQPLLRRISGKVDVQWLFPTLSWLNPLLSETSWLRFDGDAEVRAALQINNGQLLPGSNAGITRANLQARLFDKVFAGLARAEARIGEGASDVQLTLDRFKLSEGNQGAPAYVDGRDLRITLQSSSDISTFREQMKAQLHFKDASIPDLRAYNHYLPKKSIRILGGSGSVSADISVNQGGVIDTSHVQLHGRNAAIRFGASTLRGNLNLDTHVNRAHGGDNLYSVQDFVVGLKDVRVDGDTGLAPWWATLSLGRGSLYWRQPYRLEGNMRMAMKDASAMLSLFEKKKDLPKWIEKLVDHGAINANGVVSVSGDSVVLDRMHANNERFDLQSRIRIAGGVPHGDLYARWGVLGLGIEQRGTQRKLHLVKAKQWYESQPDLLRATHKK